MFEGLLPFPKKTNLKAIAVLTSGGDAPGMNAAIRGVVRTALAHQVQVYGVMKGYSGLVEEIFQPMQLNSVANIIQRGGTILKTDRCPEFLYKNVRKRAAESLRERGIDGLVVIGGDGSFTGANILEKETGFPCIGVPGTIDNDIFGTDLTIGFDTAVNTALEAMDRIRDTASSHDRVFLVEVMGRNSGFIALYSGISGGAETILTPEEYKNHSSKFEAEKVAKLIRRGAGRGKSSSLIVVAEGHTPGRATELAKRLTQLGFSPKVCTLGHIQRGGVPTAMDRVLGSILGSQAVVRLAKGQSSGMMGIKNFETVFVPFTKVIGKSKRTPEQGMMLAKILAT